MTEPLQQYIRMYRKRTGLSQVEVGLLLGGKASASELSRHERGERLPSLRTALAYEIVFQIPIAQLFEGLNAEIEREIAARVRTVRDTVRGQEPRVLADRKLWHLSEIREHARQHHGKVL